MLISANDMNTSETAREPASTPDNGQNSRSRKRSTRAAGPVAAIQPSNVTRSAPGGGAALPKTTALPAVPTGSVVSVAPRPRSASPSVSRSEGQTRNGAAAVRSSSEATTAPGKQ